MSTTFDVIPSSRADVKFGEVLELARGYLTAFLSEFGIEGKIELQAELIGETTRRDVSFDELFKWSRQTYAWISVRDVPGGTDVYCDTIADVENTDQPWWFLDELKVAPNYSTALDERLLAARKHDIRWNFRRSAGQPAIINLAYGLMAASLAELTDGLVYSSDNAWEYRLFPSTGPELRRSYFKPALASEPDKAEWAERNIASLRGRKS